MYSTKNNNDSINCNLTPLSVIFFAIPQQAASLFDFAVRVFRLSLRRYTAVVFVTNTYAYGGIQFWDLMH